MTHGFFKGLLFLGSGSVIHAVHEEQDMNKMGAPVAEDPDHPLDDAHRRDRDRRHPAAGRVLQQGRDPGRELQERLRAGSGSIGVVVAVMTGFYMFRLMGKTFYGESHVDPHVEPNIHESPRSMTVPLILLAIPSIFLGLASACRPGRA